MTGATGVIGRRVIPQLLAAGHEVTAIGRTAEKRKALNRAGAVAVDVSLFDVATLSRAVAGHDIVINLATRIPPSSRTFLPGAWRENSRIRRVGSSNLTAAALSGGAKHFIQESFAPIYGDGGDEWLDENAAIEPARYNAAVVDAEAAAARFAGNGRTGVALRFAFFYGPDSGFLIDMIRYIRKGLAPAFGSPQGFISSISHDDAASAVMAALEVPSGVYNVADDQPVRRRQFYDSLAEALGVKPPRFPPAWLARVFGSIGDTLARSQRISNRKFRQSSSWSPSIPSVTQAWPVVLGEVRSQ